MTAAIYAGGLLTGYLVGFLATYAFGLTGIAPTPSDNSGARAPAHTT